MKIDPQHFPNIHPHFPQQVWVVIEQPPGESQRIEYDLETAQFVKTDYGFLPNHRGYKHAYGWIGGLGHPPQSHVDVFLITDQPLKPGSICVGYPCGVFFRRDGDHKVVALDLLYAQQHPSLEFDHLGLAMQQELKAIYPDVAANEGWKNRESACQYLLSKQISTSE